jgi:hypothetical protein
MRNAFLLLSLIGFLPGPASANDAVFAPGGSDFSVTFSAKPVVTEFETITTDGKTVVGKRAELRTESGFQRAELLPMPPGFSDAETKESVTERAKQYAIHTGLTAPEFHWSITAHGKKLSMRGTKILQDRGQAKAVTYETVFWYGRSSLLALYVGAESTKYPTSSITQFLNSVKKKE